MQCGSGQIIHGRGSRLSGSNFWQYGTTLGAWWGPKSPWEGLEVQWEGLKPFSGVEPGPFSRLAGAYNLSQSAEVTPPACRCLSLLSSEEEEKRENSSAALRDQEPRQAGTESHTACSSAGGRKQRANTRLRLFLDVQGGLNWTLSGVEAALRESSSRNDNDDEGDGGSVTP